MKNTSIITRDPSVRSGQPCIRGYRLTVAEILGQLAGGDSIETVLEDYPFLTRDDVLAALSFASESMRKIYDSAADQTPGAAA